MFQFPGFASSSYVFRTGYPRKGGFPHSDIRGSTIARISPQLIAACHVLHRLLVPRHPPNALYCLILSFPSAPVSRGGNPRATPSPFGPGRRRFEFSSRHDDDTRSRLRENQHHRRTLFTISNNSVPRDRTATPWGARNACERSAEASASTDGGGGRD